MKTSPLSKLCRLAVGLSLVGLPLAVAAADAPSPAPPGAEKQVPSDADVLLNLFQKKGLISNQEAKEAREALAQRAVQPPDASKLKLNPALKGLELFGDARLRYEWREGQSPGSDTLSRERFRYRLRFGAKGEFKDDFYYGLRLETGDSSRSSNLTFGNDAGGPSSKTDDKINVGQIYLGWKATDSLTLEAGRMANPLVTSSLVWDPDITPEGASERFKHSVGKFDLFATFGQFLYDDANPENPFGTGALKSDAFLLAWQVGAKYNLNDNMSVLIAPTLYNYTGQGDSHGTVYDPSVALGKFAINDLLVFEVPAEFNFTALNRPWKAFADFAVNLQASDRAAAARALAPAAYPGTGDEGFAYQIGLQVGKAAKKNTWEAKAFWQHTELFSLDPNLVDSDLFDSIVNFEGFVLQFGYAIRDNITGNLTYARGDRANKSLPTGAGGDIGGVGDRKSVV